MRKKPEHLYLQLTHQLMEQIHRGVYSEGSLLPSERELCEIHGLSRTTVRLALRTLMERGYVKCVHGKGTIVLHSPVRQELNSIYSFDADMRRLGKVPGTRVLDLLEVVAPEGVASALGFAKGETVYRILRLRLADGEPMLLETNYLPAARFPELDKQALEEGSLYEMLGAQYGLSITIAEETFEPILLRPMEAQLLGTEADSLGMMIQRVSYENGRAVELSQSVSPASKFKPHVILTQESRFWREHKG